MKATIVFNFDVLMLISLIIFFIKMKTSMSILNLAILVGRGDLKMSLYLQTSNTGL